MENQADRIDSCFVLITPNAELDRLWNALIRPAVQQAGMTPLRVADMVSCADIVQKSIRDMLSARVVVAVVTRTNPYILDGSVKALHLFKKKALLIQEKGGEQPIGDHYQFPFLEYDPHDFPKSRDAITAALVRLHAQESFDIPHAEEMISFIFERSKEMMFGAPKLPVLISRPSPARQEGYELPLLPMTIKHFEIRDFQCIRSTGIDDLPPDAPWILITGDNGDGKTSLLQAIAIGLHGTEDAERLLKDNPPAHIGVEVQEGEHSVVRDFVQWDKHWIMTDHASQEIAPLSNLLAYGPSRLNISDEESTASGKANRGPVYTLLHQRGNLRNIEYWLKMCALSASTDPDGREAQRAEAVKKLLVELMPNVTHMELVGSTFRYTEKGHTVSLNSLSSGQTSLLAMVGDLLIRLYETQPDIVDPKELQGIVLIDELDIHLHPSRQKALPGQLSHIFPNVQFIATTHSVIPILGAPPGSVFLRVVRESEEGTSKKGTQVERLEIEVANLLPNALLTSPLFDMPSLRAVQNKKLADVYTDDAYEEIERKKRVDEALERLAQAGNILPKGFLESEE